MLWKFWVGRSSPYRSAAGAMLLQECLGPGAVTAGPVDVVVCTGLLEDRQRRVVGLDRLAEGVGPRLPLAQPHERDAEAGLGLGPVERGPLAGAHLERR